MEGGEISRSGENALVYLPTMGGGRNLPPGRYPRVYPPRRKMSRVEDTLLHLVELYSLM